VKLLPIKKMGKIDAPIQENTKVFEEIPQTGAILTDEEREVLVTVVEEKGDETDLISLRMFFGIEVDDLSQDEDLQEILSFCREKGIDSREELRKYLSSLEAKMGIGLLLGHRAKQIAFYLRMVGQYNKTKKILEQVKGKI
jgi:hypothetical protein